MRSRRSFALITAALVATAVGAIGFGVADIAPLDVLAILGRSLFGLPVGGEIGAGPSAIVMEIRLPRILAAAAVDRKSTRLNSSHIPLSRMPSSA